MGKQYIAEKRVEHKIIAGGPDLIIPPGSTCPVPCITMVTLDNAVNTAKKTRGNGYPLFTYGSHVPHCVGGIPGGRGIKSGKWNGKYWPDEHSDSVRVEGQWAIFHHHKGKGNG